MSDDRSFRGDPSVKWALKQGFSPWEIMLVCCPRCGAHNYFEPGVSESCRLCGTKIADREDEMFSVGAAMEQIIERERERAWNEVEEIFNPDETTVLIPTTEEPPPERPEAVRWNRILTMLWILICIGFVAALAAMTRFFDGKF